jgi:hypothetical protein
MSTIFATHNGFVRNNAVVDTQVTAAAAFARSHEPSATAAPKEDAGGHQDSGLGGQIGELAAAINAVGWNHNQVPPEERLPLEERLFEPPHPTATEPSGLGGQIGELAAAINAVGWNHNQVPPEERLPPQERV